LSGLFVEIPIAVFSSGMSMSAQKLMGTRIASFIVLRASDLQS
jgi:hypothetical protein